MDDVLATTGHRDAVRESWSGCHEWSRQTDGRSLLEVPIRLVLARSKAEAPRLLAKGVHLARDHALNGCGAWITASTSCPIGS